MSFGDGNLRERCAELEHMVETRDESIRNLVKLLDKRLDKRHGRIEELEQLVRDMWACYEHASCAGCSMELRCKDPRGMFVERLHELGIEAD